jgi:hypothetical protein
VRSPFPGMNPYLESHAWWTSFQTWFIATWCEAIAEKLPDHYDANIAEQVWLTKDVPRLDEARQPYIEILHRPDERLVAVLEVLSPANKENPGRRDYLTKRNALLLQPIHLIELELLRRGQRLPMERALPSGDYYYLLCRSEKRFDCDVYTWSLRAPLPTLPVPLLEPDPDILIDLSVAFDQAFQRGRFSKRMKYRDDLPGKLDADTLRWVREQTAT